MGASDVLVIEQDLGSEEGCKAAVDAAIAHFKTSKQNLDFDLSF